MNNKFFIHNNSIVETKDIGENTTIWAFVHILDGVKVGKNVNICDHCFIENGVIIGDNVTIKSGVHIWKGVTIEDDVFVGPCVAFSNDAYPRSKNRNFELKGIILSKGSSIGANSTLLPGIRVGKYALIGAGSVVTKNIPDYAVAYGNPTIVTGFICSCNTKMTFKEDGYDCVCGKKYVKKNNVVIAV
jgi:acetyltransferase-like isoleucine patch superfamily enzyme